MWLERWWKWSRPDAYWRPKQAREHLFICKCDPGCKKEWMPVLQQLQVKESSEETDWSCLADMSHCTLCFLMVWATPCWHWPWIWEKTNSWCSVSPLVALWLLHWVPEIYWQLQNDWERTKCKRPCLLNLCVEMGHRLQMGELLLWIYCANRHSLLLW